MKTNPDDTSTVVNMAQDGEVGLVYRMNGKSYAVALTRDQHTLLQSIVPSLGILHVAKSCEVDFVASLNETSTTN